MILVCNKRQYRRRGPLQLEISACWQFSTVSIQDTSIESSKYSYFVTAMTRKLAAYQNLDCYLACAQRLHHARLTHVVTPSLVQLSRQEQVHFYLGSEAAASLAKCSWLAAGRTLPCPALIPLRLCQRPSKLPSSFQASRLWSLSGVRHIMRNMLTLGDGLAAASFCCSAAHIPCRTRTLSPWFACTFLFGG